MSVASCAAGSAHMMVMLANAMTKDCPRQVQAKRSSSGQFDVQLLTLGLGYLVIALGAVRQLPGLLYKILRDKTGTSYISKANIITLFITNTNFVVYAVQMDLPLHTWGEGLLQMGFYVIIVLLMLLYHGRQCYAVLFMLTYFTLVILLLWPVVPSDVGWGLMAVNVPILALRKVNWIYNCHRKKGQTHFSSLVNLVLMNFCCMCRLLTSVTDVGDGLLIFFYLQEFSLNLVIISQCCHFSRKRRRLAAEKRSNCPSG